jgi:S-adenosylmethionine hydrolase
MAVSRSLRLFGLALLAFASLGLMPTHAAPPPTICLLTDYGEQDPYVSQLKGVITTICPTARIIDLTHDVAPFNITQGSYLLDQCSQDFPPGTIFVAVVDPQVGTDRDAILVETKKGNYFVGPDNGLMTSVIDRQGLSRAWKLNKPEYYRAGGDSHTFHGRDIFAPVAAHLADGTNPDRMGQLIKTMVMLPIKEPSLSNGSITVEVLHIDRYGNIILNLAKTDPLADKLKEGNLIKVSAGKQSISGPLMKTYGDMEKGRTLLLYGGNGLLEIAVNQGSAAKELKVEPGTLLILKP